jgi:hypothetical protein
MYAAAARSLVKHGMMSGLDALIIACANTSVDDIRVVCAGLSASSTARAGILGKREARSLHITLNPKQIISQTLWAQHNGHLIASLELDVGLIFSPHVAYTMGQVASLCRPTQVIVLDSSDEYACRLEGELDRWPLLVNAWYAQAFLAGMASWYAHAPGAVTVTWPQQHRVAMANDGDHPDMTLQGWDTIAERGYVCGVQHLGLKLNQDEHQPGPGDRGSVLARFEQLRSLQVAASDPWFADDDCLEAWCSVILFDLPCLTVLVLQERHNRVLAALDRAYAQRQQQDQQHQQQQQQHQQQQDNFRSSSSRSSTIRKLFLDSNEEEGAPNFPLVIPAALQEHLEVVGVWLRWPHESGMSFWQSLMQCPRLRVLMWGGYAVDVEDDDPVVTEHGNVVAALSASEHGPREVVLAAWADARCFGEMLAQAVEAGGLPWLEIVTVETVQQQQVMRQVLVANGHFGINVRVQCFAQRWRQEWLSM